MTKTCKYCTQNFEITDEDLKFYDQFQVPTPKGCPNCRLLRRMQELNPKSLYYRKCDFTGEEIISQYHSDHPFPVYQLKIWWGDEWDAITYGQDFDFNKPFFPQFKELKYRTPHMALFTILGMENSDFTNCTGYLKNCYLIAESDYNEDCYYSNLLNKCKNVSDCSVCYECELCYQCIDCQNCHNLKFSQDCRSCQDSYFLRECQNCRDCIGCINQRHKQYMIFNKQYSKEKYEQMKSTMHLDTRSGLKKVAEKANDLFLTQPHKNLTIENTENSSGDHLYNTKNAYYCFDCKDIEDCRYCTKLSLKAKSCMDYGSWGDKAELVYQSASSGDNAYNIKFCTNCTINIRDLDYCDQCSSSSDLFGCVSLKRKKYCILNKQYSKEDYFALKKKIIEHMKETGEYGEYFPADVCPYGHNETLSQDFFPLSKEEALARGFKWRDEDRSNRYQGALPEIPERSSELPDEISKQILGCKSCGKNYRLISQEVTFYKMMNVPAPTQCFDCRHKGRIQARNPLKIWQRTCARCSKSINTSYAPDRPEIIYCDKCYLETVY